MAINDNELYALKGKQVKDLANRIESKQDTLTAGANISISEQNEISATIPSAFQTIFYANLGETGTSKHIYKNSDMTGAASAQDILDANNAGQVILRMSTSADPTQFSDAYLQNTYVGQNDYQFLFLDERTYREYDATATTDTTFYYSSTEVQLKLTAGANVSISGNTISATDTTYSDFVGTDGTAVGTAGLVPAPAITDAGKFLKADGTWDTAGGSGPTVVQTTGTSTTDVMSQDATTKIAFSDGSAQQKIRIGSGASVTQSSAIAIGVNAAASGVNAYGSIAIGGSAKAPGRGAIAIGEGANATAQGELNIGTNNTYRGYNSTNYRLISGVHDGQNAHDVATKGQLDGLITMTSTDPGEGSPLSANTFIAVYNAS